MAFDILYTYWSTSVRVEEVWQDELETKVKLNEGIWVAVRYTGEYITAKTTPEND